MTDAQFYNGFTFRKYEYNRYHTTDNTKTGSPRHFFAKLIAGSAKLQMATATVTLHAGDVFYIPYGIPYRSHWYPESGVNSFYSIGFSHLPSPVDYALQKIEGASALFDECFSDITVSADSIARLYRFFAQVKDQMMPRNNLPQEVTAMRALDFMRAHPQARAAETAAHLNISESGLYGILRSSLGKTPLEIRRGLLVEQAEELLLTTDLSIEEISARLGLSSSSYFRKVFSRMTGTTPSAIRKQRL
jgi:AraC-like DNA-binding protein